MAYLSNGKWVNLSAETVDGIRKQSRLILNRLGLTRDQVVRLANRYGHCFHSSETALI